MQLAAQIPINIYIILVQGCVMSIFSLSDVEKHLNESEYVANNPSAGQQRHNEETRFTSLQRL